ncbi:MAG TPA: TauD/TfdA family dioxygenase, partial [Stellaceae bacterium]|nr:TauD/TfdA family dioxygenase [Stellaceae bacterium]
RPGEMYFLNNYTILHARTAFDDGDAAEDDRRHLLRLWLEAPWMRQVHPHVHLFESGVGIAPVSGRTPSFDWRPLTSDRVDHGITTPLSSE